ncbi:Quaternary ammonium compound-resistance protein sugE [Rhodovulum sp. PH10]|uniref:DMT family transporter n=1 Tax=Rhodovulum sp. PH10 TaxID=1187851 RepID=UPI00027C28FE|nr:multidrug efflux SMR transporter [Rhodovulum sp. PH10]EJW11737.1 Quaternary ammonium compound-resistance protein sugE [Rhodovulum sp. PH10]
MAWLFLLLAGACEIGWPIGLKLGWTAAGVRPLWLVFAVVCITASGFLLLLAQREIPMGTAYAVWTGIGAVGAFLVGVFAFGDPGTAMRFASVGLIVLGIVGLKLA